VLTFNSGSRTDSSNWVVSLLAGSLDADQGSVDGLGGAARFTIPTKIAIIPTGDAYVADAGKIRRLSPEGRVTTFAGSSTGYADGQGTTTAKFGATLGGLAVDAAGFLYVADPGNSVIRRVTPGGSVTTVAGTVNASGTAADGTGQSAVFAAFGVGPAGLACLPSGDLVCSESGRLRIVQRIIRD
jgi:hypothetical protein